MIVCECTRCPRCQALRAPDDAAPARAAALLHWCDGCGQVWGHLRAGADLALIDAWLAAVLAHRAAPAAGAAAAGRRPTSALGAR